MRARARLIAGELGPRHGRRRPASPPVSSRSPATRPGLAGHGEALPCRQRSSRTSSPAMARGWLTVVPLGLAAANATDTTPFIGRMLDEGSLNPGAEEQRQRRQPKTLWEQNFAELAMISLSPRQKNLFRLGFMQ
ncbi:hypothetical protein NL676_014701 [Syzygium grande]|nr:hypothetical protein NL676_014701 [Syzygium grande]